MKKFNTLVILIAFMTSMSSAASASLTLVSIKANAKTKTLLRQTPSVPKFSGINVSGPFNVTVQFGQKEEIRMEGDKEIISRIETKVENGILRIGFRERRNWNWGSDRASDVRISVKVKNLKSFSVSGSGKANIEGEVRGDSFTSVVSGSGSLTSNIRVKAYSGVISGSGSIAASGMSENSSITISGSGTFRGKDLKSGRAEVRVSGSGNATIHAESHLEAVLSGSGNIRYSGDPHVDVTKSGSGNVSKL